MKAIETTDKLPDLPHSGLRLLTVAEAASELRCSKAHVCNLITGKVRGVAPLPSLRLGRRRLILRANLDQWIEANVHVL